MPHVPNVIPRMLSSVSAEESAQALMSNIPPATGVPAASPVASAAAAVISPQISDDRRSGGSFSRKDPRPKASRTCCVVTLAADVHQAGARHVGQLGKRLSSQTAADIVLAHQRPSVVRCSDVRFVIAQPGQQCVRLTGPESLHGQRANRAIDALGHPAIDV